MIFRSHDEQARGAGGFDGGRFCADYFAFLVVPFNVLLLYWWLLKLAIIILFLPPILKWLRLFRILWYGRGIMSEETNTQENNEFDPSAGNPFVGEAGKIAERTFVNETPVEEVEEVEKVAKRPKSIGGKVVAASLAGVLTVGAGVVLNETVGGEIRDAITPDKIIASTSITLNQGETPLDLVEESARSLVENTPNVDPASVDFGELYDLTIKAADQAKQLTGETSLQPGTDFSIVLSDTGDGHHFTVSPGKLPTRDD